MIEPPYESRAKRRRVKRTVSTYTGAIRRGGRRHMTHAQFTYGYGRLFHNVTRMYNGRTRYDHSPRWRKKYGSW